MNNIEQKAKSILPTIENRHFIRHPLSIPLICKVIKNLPARQEKEVPVMTANVSLGGLLFCAKRPFKVGSLIAVKMPFKDKVLNLKSKVVHCVKSPEARLYNIGISFLELNDAFRAKLVEQFYLIVEYRNLRSVQLGKEISLEEASKEWIEKYAERFKKFYW